MNENLHETQHDFYILSGGTSGKPVCRIYHSDINEWTIDFDLRTGLDYTGRVFTRETRAAAIEFVRHQRLIDEEIATSRAVEIARREIADEYERIDREYDEYLRSQ